jgi:U3 small nucleolar RNA-associated protein 15
VKFFELDKILSFSDDKSVGLFDIVTTNQIMGFKGHSDYVRSGCVLSNHLIASGSYDHSVKIWDTKTNECIQTLDHGKPIESIIKHPTAPIFVTSGGSYFKVWDLLNFKFKKYTSHQNTITKLQFNNDGTKMFSSSLDGYLKFYDVNDYSIIHSMKFEEQLLSFDISVR